MCLLICGAGSIGAVPPSAPSAGDVQETRLPNGLVVLTKESHAAPVVCTYVWYHVGSRNERPGITGISHQLEHMMFKGTKRLFPNPGYIDLLVGRYGGENNAQTDTDSTSYYLLLPSDQLDLALRIEADRMTQAAIDPKQLAVENTVVLSELEGDENDNAYFLYENTRATAYQYHPYHYPVIGTKWDVQHFTRAQVYDYYRQHYAPNNATLVVVGDFHTAQLLARVRQLWQDVKPAPVPAAVVNPEPPQRGERRILVRRAGATTYVELMYHIPAAIHPDLPALAVLATALSNGRSSRLYRALVETQLATAVSAVANEGIDPEVFDITLTARSGVTPATLETAALTELERLQKAPLEKDELQKAKNQTRADFIFAQESMQTQAARLGFYQTVTNDWRNLSTYLNRINAVTAADIQRVAQTYLAADNRTVGTFLPTGEKPAPGSDSGGAHSVHYRPEKPDLAARGGVPWFAPHGKAPRDTVPAAANRVQQRRLPNGLTVIVEENHANPTVTIGGFVRAGSVDDLAGKEGLANLVANMLVRGTTSRSSQQIAQETDFVGASIEIDAGRERTDLSGAMLKENFDSILALLADVLRHPGFPAEELEKAKGEMLTALREEANDTATVATKRLYDALYPVDDPYRHWPEGTLESVPGITVEDLRAFYRRNYRPERATLILVGDVTAANAFAAVEKVFGDWAGEGAAVPEYVPNRVIPNPAPPRPIIITLPDKSQDDVAMGAIGIARNTPDFEAAALMNLILGEDEFVGRVGKRVRDTEGLAYYAYTAFSPGLQAGPWVFRAGVNPRNVSRALASARDEVRKMVARGVTEDELNWAKDHVIGSRRLAMATNAGIAAELETDVFYGLGLDYAERYPQIVRRITRAQVDAAAKRYLHPEALVTVIAGPPVTTVTGDRGSSR